MNRYQNQQNFIILRICILFERIHRPTQRSILVGPKSTLDASSDHTVSVWRGTICAHPTGTYFVGDTGKLNLTQSQSSFIKKKSISYISITTELTTHVYRSYDNFNFQFYDFSS